MNSVELERLLPFFKGERSAAELVMMLAQLSHTWDDLIDKDKAVTDARINTAFWIALVAVPSNLFYRRFSDELRPVITTSCLNYFAANGLEKKGDRTSLEIASVIRCSLADVALLAATLVGGAEWGMTVAADLRLLFQDDSLEAYLKEKLHEPAS